MAQFDPPPRSVRDLGRGRERRFRLALFAGLAPILFAGFLVSGIANRTVFAGWALLIGALYVALVWLGFRRRWGGWLLGGRALLVLAAGLALFARLVEREYAELDLGLRAVVPALYRPALSDPRSSVYAAIFLAVCGVLLILISHGARRAGGTAGAPGRR